MATPGAGVLPIPNCIETTKGQPRSVFPHPAARRQIHLPPASRKAYETGHEAYSAQLILKPSLGVN